MPLVASSARVPARRECGRYWRTGADYCVTATVLAIFFVPVFVVRRAALAAAKAEDIEHSHSTEHR